VIESESGFQGWVMQLAEVHGWRTLHVGKCPKRNYTPTQGTMSKGWPDLVLIRAGVMICVECKTDRKYPTPAQKDIHDALEECGIPVYVWKPKDRQAIEEVLR
jgi:hypothetical protein